MPRNYETSVAAGAEFKTTLGSDGFYSARHIAIQPPPPINALEALKRDKNELGIKLTWMDINVVIGDERNPSYCDIRYYPADNPFMDTLEVITPEVIDAATKITDYLRQMRGVGDSNIDELTSIVSIRETGPINWTDGRF